MPKPGFIKRLVVVVYDGLLLFGAILFSSLVLMALFNALAPPSFYIGQPVDGQLSTLEHSALGRTIGGILLFGNLVVVSFLFYGWFWTHGGQTLGMRAWHLYLVKSDGKFISWKEAAIRYCAAILSWLAFGAGFIWILFNTQRLAWHDMLSGSSIVISKPKNEGKE